MTRRTSRIVLLWASLVLLPAALLRTSAADGAVSRATTADAIERKQQGRGGRTVATATKHRRAGRAAVSAARRRRLNPTVGAEGGDDGEDDGGSSDIGDGSELDDVMVEETETETQTTVTETDEKTGPSDDVGDGNGADADEAVTAMREGGANTAAAAATMAAATAATGAEATADEATAEAGAEAEASQTPVQTPKGGKVPLNEIEAEQAEEAHEEGVENGNAWPVFLSATLNMRLHPVPGQMNSARQTIFATSVTRFLNKVFDGQSTYDIAVRSVNVIRQERGSAASRRRLVVRRKERGRQRVQQRREGRVVQGHHQHTRGGLSGGGGTAAKRRRIEDAAAEAAEAESETPTEQEAAAEVNNGQGQGQVHAVDEVLDVEVVVAAQYVEANSQRSLDSDQFGKLLLRIFNKFEEHLVKYMKDLERERVGDDPEEVYFAEIEDVLVESYLAAVTEKVKEGMVENGHAGGATGRTYGEDSSGERLDTTAIIAIVFGSLGLFAFVAAIFIKLSWEGKLGMGNGKNNKSSPTGAKTAASGSFEEYNIQDIVHTNSFTYSTNDEIIKSMGSSGSGGTKKSKRRKKGGGGHRTIFRRKDGGAQGDTGSRAAGGGKDEFESRISRYDMSARYGISEEDADGNETASHANNTRLSTDESVLQTEMERQVSPRAASSQFQRREFTAPPGKLGVAIDSVNGHPVVHRIKDGSPLVGVLQRLDRIVAIDGTDTSSMSAADVTYLMVKGMNKPRRITYVREE